MFTTGTQISIIVVLFFVAQNLWVMPLLHSPQIYKRFCKGIKNGKYFDALERKIRKKHKHTLTHNHIARKVAIAKASDLSEATMCPYIKLLYLCGLGFAFK